MSYPLLVIASIACVLLAAEVSAISKTQFFVSPNGSDAWSGRLAVPNRTRTDGPFATLERARDAARELKDPGSEVTISLRGGTYFLDRTFTLGPQDTHPVTFTAYRGERVTISGGRPITGFREAEVNGRKMLAAQIPEVKSGDWYFTQLFVNGRRRPRTRLPKKGCYRVKDVPGVEKNGPWHPGQDRFIFNPGDINAAWKNLGDVDIVTVNYWVESRMQIKSVDESANEVIMNKPSTNRLWADRGNGEGARYWVENVFEALDTPGQWYLDRPTGTLYYYPVKGEDARNLSVIAPRLEQLVVVGVDMPENGRLSGIHFRNLRFAHTEPVHQPDKAGFAQAAFGVPGAVQFQRAVDCSISNCEISGIGTYAIEVGPGKSPWGKPVEVGKHPSCERVRVERNRMVDLGAGGVKVQPDSERTTVSDNDIGDGGKIFMSAVGVWIGDSPGNVVAHNHIHHLDYTGVSVGWRWGYAECRAKDNKVEFNHIHHVGRNVLSDLGGIYTLGTQPGTVLRNNLIHDCYSASYGGWGLYTDEGSSYILLENNVVYNTKTGGFHQHYGKENIVLNNIFAFAKEQQLQRTRAEEHISFFFERNIVYYDSGILLANSWKDDKFKMDYNVYWDASGRPVTFAGLSFEEWKKRGFDTHSVVTDPLFVDAKKRDFRLKPESPALKLGFKPIDVSSVGPRFPVGPAKAGE